VIICGNCSAEVFWSMPRPEDPCPECGQEIGVRRPVKPRKPRARSPLSAKERRELEAFEDDSLTPDDIASIVRGEVPPS
jgi:hypothetical protein